MTETPFGLDQNLIFPGASVEKHATGNTIEAITVSIDQPFAADMTVKEAENILENFDERGIVVLDFEATDQPHVIRENLLTLSHYFGGLLGHKHARGGIVDITTTPL